MKGMFLILAAIALTALSWGAYGPVLHRGQVAMQGSRLRPLFCVGMAYFVIAVIVPTAMLMMRGEKGTWSTSGTFWSLAAGAAGAIGALGIILAFNFGGKPTYVMPLVFGCAPVVNGFITIYLSGAWRSANPLTLAGLLAGLGLVAVGAFMVLFFATKFHAPPSPGGHPPTAAAHSTTH